ncbi:MAG TPA: hypothetical protein VGN37_30670 [Actinocatenispora sp.]
MRSVLDRRPRTAPAPTGPRPPARFATHLAGWLALGAAVATGATVLIWWGTGAPRAAVLGDRLDLVRIALTVTGGVGGVVALTIAYRKQRLAETAERREDTKVYAERYGRCAEQLGSERPAVRMAGVHALAGLADDWPAGRQTCVDVLCSYLRMPYASAQPDDPAERQVRQTVLRVIADRLRPGAAVPWQGYDVDFSDALLDGANLRGIRLVGGSLRFDGAVLATGTLDLSGATVSDCRISFTGAELTGGTVLADWAEFERAALDLDRSRCTAGAVELTRCSFRDSRLGLRGATIRGGGIRLNRTVFVGGGLSLRGAELAGGDVVLHKADLDGTEISMDDMTLTGGTVGFARSRIVSSALSLHHATLAGGTLDVSGVYLAGTAVDLRGADLTGTAIRVDRSFPREVFDLAEAARCVGSPFVDENAPG